MKLPLILALCVASALGAEDPTLDYEFRQAAEEGKVSVAEMVRRLKDEMPRIADSFGFEDVFVAALRKANEAELKEVEGLLRVMPSDSFCFAGCFSSYSARMIRDRVAELAKKPVRLEFKPTAEELPKELADAPASWRAAWKLYRSVMAPYLTITAPAEKADAPRKKTPELEVDLRRVIGKPEPESWKHLLEHQWGHWCGTGSETLYHPRNRALLLSFLADGKLQEAAGVALAQVPAMSVNRNQDNMDSVAVDLITALGLDWEQVALGSILPVTSYNGTNRRPVVSSGFSEFDAWRLLSIRGSDGAVGQCLDLIRRTKLDPRNAGDFLTLSLGSKPARSQKTRNEVISVFAEYLAPTSSPADLVDIMDAVPKHCVGELREPLTALLGHRVHAVGAKALRLLGDAGLTNGRESIAPVPRPLKFRLILNGKPQSDLKVSVEALPKRAAGAKVEAPTPLNSDVTLVSNSIDAQFARALAPSQDLTTDRDGEISYPLDASLGPELIGSVRFRIGPPPYSSGFEDDLPDISASEKQKEDDLSGIPGLEERKVPQGAWPGPWIVLQLAVTAGDERVQEVALKITDLEVKLEAFAGQAAETQVAVVLRRAHSGEPFSPEAGTVKVLAKAGASAVFRRLQMGHYAVTVRAAGTARYESGSIAIGEKTTVHSVKLEPGRNVRGTAVYPDGTKISLPLSAELFRDGTKVSQRGIGEWQGLAFGKYTARISSTRDSEAAAMKAGHPLEKIAEEDRIEGREVSFVIDASTAATLDLGEIVVPREKR
jgi:hypothetical protein